MFKTTSKSLTLRPEAQLAQIRKVMDRNDFGSFANSPECLVLCGERYRGPVAMLWFSNQGGLNFTQVSFRGKVMRSFHSYEDANTFGDQPGRTFTVSMLDTMIAERKAPKPTPAPKSGGWSPARRAAYERTIANRRRG